MYSEKSCSIKRKRSKVVLMLHRNQLLKVYFDMGSANKLALDAKNFQYRLHEVAKLTEKKFFQSTSSIQTKLNQVYKFLDKVLIQNIDLFLLTLFLNRFNSVYFTSFCNMRGKFLLYNSTNTYYTRILLSRFILHQRRF